MRVFPAWEMNDGDVAAFVSLFPLCDCSRVSARGWMPKMLCGDRGSMPSTRLERSGGSVVEWPWSSGLVR